METTNIFKTISLNPLHVYSYSPSQTTFILISLKRKLKIFTFHKCFLFISSTKVFIFFFCFFFLTSNKCFFHILFVQKDKFLHCFAIKVGHQKISFKIENFFKWISFHLAFPKSSQKKKKKKTRKKSKTNEFSCDSQLRRVR